MLFLFCKHSASHSVSCISLSLFVDMTTRLFLLSLLMALLTAAPLGEAWACGHESKPAPAGKEAQHRSCCHKGDDNSASPRAHAPAGKGCPCDHAHGGCPCPGCGVVCHTAGAFPMEMGMTLTLLPAGTALQSRAFYFAEHLPEAVYLPIWQPPKLRA